MSDAKRQPFTAYIVDCVRTAGGRRNGKLSKFHAADLGSLTLNALVQKSKVAPASVDDVIVGCVSQVGSQGANLGRTIVLGSVLPQTVPGTTVDRQCGSSLQAIHFAAQAVMSGTQDIVIAGGVENMTQVPIGSSVIAGLKADLGHPFKGDELIKKYGEPAFSQFEGAELLAKKWGITRAAMDALAVDSHKKGAAATAAGYFKNEIAPIKVVDEKGKESFHTKDEGVRTDVSLAKLSALKPLAGDEGLITAGTSSQICDGAAFVLIMNEIGLKKSGLKPRAKIVALGLAGDDPVVMLGGPIPATENVLKRAGLKITDIDLYEVNEAFASVPLAWAKAVGADLNKLNVNGGAMALGHPLGGTGAKLTTTLVNELERRKARYGLLAICEGGGTANATIIERVDAAALKSKL